MMQALQAAAASFCNTEHNAMRIMALAAICVLCNALCA